MVTMVTASYLRQYLSGIGHLLREEDVCEKNALCGCPMAHFWWRSGQIRDSFFLADLGVCEKEAS